MVRGGTDERVVLFVKLEDGCALGDALVARIRAEIRKRRTARHVPEKVSINSAPSNKFKV